MTDLTAALATAAACGVITLSGCGTLSSGDESGRQPGLSGSEAAASSGPSTSETPSAGDSSPDDSPDESASPASSAPSPSDDDTTPEATETASSSTPTASKSTSETTESGKKPPTPGGDGLPPAIGDIPIPFGTVDVLSSHSKDGTVKNPGDPREGDFSVRIKAIRVVDVRVPSPFTVSAADCRDAVLGEGASCTFTATFHPAEVGTYKAAVMVDWEYEFFDASGTWRAGTLSGTAKNPQVIGN